MFKIIAFTAFMACASAAPGVLLSHSVPVVHAPVVHAAVPVIASKTTISRSSLNVNHGTPLVHAPVVHAVHAAPVVHAVHAAPVVHAVHAAPVVHATHVVAVKSVPLVNTVSHQSSTVHHGTPLVKSVIPIAVYHH